MSPGGRHEASDYTFPYPDSSFDLVFAVSLFTHLLPESAERYISEARRVLAPEGRVLLTWFLLADRPAPAPYFDFSERVGVASAVSRENPEAAIAYPESWLRDRFAAHDLTLRDPVHYGSWRGISSLCYQDIVVATGA